jgi:3-phosphoshikimate 1-carboxyvinyltransferase
MSLPDLIEIVPLDKPVRAEITVPGSKSITNRALILAALVDGEVTLEGALWSEDTQIMVECLQELGFMVNVAPDPNEICNRTITVYGQGGKVPGGGTAENPLELFVGNAGTAARFLAALVCLGKGVYRLHGVPRMHERPQAALFQALRELGYRVDSPNDKLPATIFGGGLPRPARNERGEGRGEGHLIKTASSPQPSPPFGEERENNIQRSCKVSIEESSQFASALLLCAKHGGWQIEITGENAEESPYVAMTSKMIEVFPHYGGKFQIEPDASSGSYFWAAGWLTYILKRLVVNPQRFADWTGSPVVVKNWPQTGWQIDSEFPDFLPFPKKVSRQEHLGDSIMTAIVLAIDRDAAHSLGFTPYYQSIQFSDLGRLRIQECERVVALRTELTKCGAKVIEEGDTLTVYPREPEELHGAEIETYNDHRMAMCFAILGLKVPGIKIKNPECVKKTFPNFFQKLAALPPKGLGAEIWEIKNGQRTRKLSGEDLFAD